MLSIMVLTYNGQHLLPDCLKSIDSQHTPNEFEKVIIDNGSTFPIVPPIGWRVVRLESNRGNIGGQNACFNNALGNKVLFVSDDVRLKPGCIELMLQNEDHISQPLILNPDGSIQNAGMDYKWPGYGIGRTLQTSTYSRITPSICYMVPKICWRVLGGFDESLISSYEDVDFWLRRNYRIYICGEAVHLGNQTLKQTISDPSSRFHKSRKMVIRKHFKGIDRWLRLLACDVIRVARLGSNVINAYCNMIGNI